MHSQPSAWSSLARRWKLISLIAVLLGVIVLAPGVLSRQPTQESGVAQCEAAPPEATRATPVTVATPRGAATPAVTPEKSSATCVGLGTPVAREGLTVALFADDPTAGPVDITVEVMDADGRPVTDAVVTVETQHLEMNHGESVNDTVPVAPGRYLAERVSMGMGGTWQAEVLIDRPGKDQVVVPFLVLLEGPA